MTNKKDNPSSRFARIMMPRLTSTSPSHSGSEESAAGLPYEVVAAASRNWLMVPVVPGVANQPIGIDRSTCDLIKLTEWANSFPGCRWAVVPGAQSGVIALEADAYAGLATAQALADMECPETLRAYAGGKMLAFFRYPGGLRAREEGKMQLAPGLVVRGEGDLVVLPSAENWPDPDAWVLETPEWLRICAFEADGESVAA